MMTIKTEIIDTTKQISELVDWIIVRHEPLAAHLPTLYIDLEGVNLCREGSVSILTLLVSTDTPTWRIYLIDVHTLGAQAFTTAGAKAKTLKDILENEKFTKVFYDVRNDSDALFAHFGVALQGVEDVQLMESATRKTTSSRRCLNGLAKCIDSNVLRSFGASGLASWKQTKGKGERLFKAEYGSSYAIFNQRPIPKDIVSYCVGDVHYLPELRDNFRVYGAHRWWELVHEESKKRVAASQRSDYLPKGPNRQLAPWSKDQNDKLDQWHYVPAANYFDEFRDLDDIFDEVDDPDDDWYDDGPTSGKDILNDCDIAYYYSD